MSGRLRAAMIRPHPHVRQTVTRPHVWDDMTSMASAEREYTCRLCGRVVYMPFGSDELDEGAILPAGYGGNCTKWQAQ